MTSGDRSVKTLAIRLDEELHAQLSVLAQLGGVTVTDAIRQAVETYVETERNQGDLAAKAAGALEEIEREANTRRSAIEALFGETAIQPTVESAKSRGRKPADGATEATR